MKRESLQRRTSEGARRIAQVRAAEQAEVERLHREAVADWQKRVKPAIKRLKVALADAADKGESEMLAVVENDYAGVIFNAICDYCRKRNLSYEDKSTRVYGEEHVVTHSQIRIWWT